MHYGVAGLILLSLTFGVWGMDYLDEQEFVLDIKQTSQAPQGKVNIVIKINERILEIFDDGKLHKTYRISVGKRDTPTPIGEWNVAWKDYGWGGGFGTRWMGLNVPWGIYGIHGTNNPWSIGRYASHGCIRMRNRDVEELFEWVPLGTEVKIIGRKVKVSRKLKLYVSGADVVILQLKLKEGGFLNGRADGLFGPTTEAAVKGFQSANSLEPTGIADRTMCEKLGI